MGWLRFLRRGRWDAEREAEIAAHLQMQIDELVADGMSPQDARAEAGRRFGNPRVVREQIYDMNSIPLFETLARDARYAVRVLRKAPLFTAAAVLTLGVAIAINTAMFSVVDAVLLRPLPYPDPASLAVVSTAVRQNGNVGQSNSQTGATWEAVRDRATMFDRAAFSRWTTGVNLVAGGRASYVQQQRVGSGFFRVLGVPPLIGREFSAEEDRSGGPAATVLSHALWHSMFAADPAVVGRTLLLRGEAATIVGVMPRGFDTGDRADLWTPLRASTTGEGEGENYAILARVRADRSWAAADAEMRQIGTDLARQQKLPEGVSMAFSLIPLQESMTADLRIPLLMLWAAVAIVLLVACVNLAGLLLARAAGRTREIATRMALGSGRAAVIRQLLVESIVLAIAGGITGVVLGYFALEGLQILARHAFEIWQPVSLDGRAVVAAAVLALGASALFGLAPALHATRLDVQAAMAESGARTVAGASSRWPRRVIVVAQVALGVLLLVGAGLLLRTFSHLRHLDPGFDPDRVVTVSVSLEDARYRTGPQVIHVFDETLRRVSAVPGVDAAAVALGVPYERLLNLGFRHLDGPQAAAPNGRMTSATYVSPDFFRAMRIPLRAGRVFDSRDTKDSAGVAIVSDTFARQYFDDGRAVGHRIGLAGFDREIVGVVGDVQVRPGWGDNGPLAAMPLAYIPVTQVSDGTLRLVHGWFSPTFVVRASNTPDATARIVRSALDATDPLLPFAEVRSMADVQAASLAQQRFLMVLLGALALSTVLLAGIGIHGLIATSVTERTREMGIRLALGATTAQAMRTLAVPGIVLAMIGVTIGAGAALLGGRLLQHFLWGIQANDPATFGGVAATLVAVACLSSVVPALKVLRLDPARTLRQE